MKITDTHVFFYGNADVFSNFHHSPFIIGGKRFTCSEQWIMYQKAILFGDHATAYQIMKSSNPSTFKSLGRRVKNFNDIIWWEKRELLTFVGLLEKFRQNPALAKELEDTKDRTLVEASPWDRVWGVGLSESDPRILDPTNWQGDNLLGKILMKVRLQIRNDFQSKLAI